MFQFVFAEAKRRSSEISKFLFWYLPIEGLKHSAFKKSQKVLVTLVFIFIYLFWKPNHQKRTLTTKKDGITMEVYGENN